MKKVSQTKKTPEQVAEELERLDEENMRQFDAEAWDAYWKSQEAPPNSTRPKKKKDIKK